MSISDERLDQLFGMAREQRPVADFDETKKAFISATVVAAGGVLATHGLLKLLTLKKWIIMMSTISVFTTGALLVGLHLNGQNQVSETEKTTHLSVVETEETVFPKQSTHLATNDKQLFAVQVADSQHQPENGGVVPLNADLQPEKEDFPEKTVAVQNHFPNKNQSIAKTTETITPYSMRFDITEKTTVKEFEDFKQRAAAEGVEFEYKARYKNDKITHLKLQLKVKDEANNTSQFMTSNADFSGKFAYTVAWKKSEDGGASDLYWGDTEKFENQESTQKRADDVDWPEMKEELAKIQQTICSDTSTFRKDLDAELAKLASELERIVDDFEREDINAEMREISSSTADLMQLIGQEMKTACGEMEKAFKEAEKAREEAEKARKEAEKTRKEAEKVQEENTK